MPCSSSTEPWKTLRPAPDHDHVIADVLDLGQQVARDEDGHALVGQRLDQAPHLHDPGRVQPVGGLIEDEERGMAAAGRRRSPVVASSRVSTG